MGSIQKEKYTSLQRVNLALNHEEPDRVPIDFGSRETTIHEETYTRLRNYLRINKKEIEYKQFFLKSIEVDKEILDFFGSDILNFEIGMEKASNPRLKIDYQNNIFKNEWGTEYKIARNGEYFHFYKFPLQTIDKSDVNSLIWPSTYNRTDDIKNRINEEFNKKEKAILLSGVTGIVAIHWFLRGLENSYIDFAYQPTQTHYLFDKILDWQIKMWNNILNNVGDYVHIIEAINDDVASEKGLLISLEHYRKFIKSRQKKLIDFIKSKIKAKIFAHSCGAIYEIIPDLIEIGVDILNPIQFTANGMEGKRLKKNFGDNLVFCGGACSNLVLQNEKPSIVEKEVKKNLEIFMKGGGYIFAPIHNIQAGVPVENILSLFKSAIKYGYY